MRKLLTLIVAVAAFLTTSAQGAVEPPLPKGFLCGVSKPVAPPTVSNNKIAGYLVSKCRVMTTSMTVQVCLYRILEGDISVEVKCARGNEVLSQYAGAFVVLACKQFRGHTSRWYVQGFAHIFEFYTLKEHFSPKVRSATVELECV